MTVSILLVVIPLTRYLIFQDYASYPNAQWGAYIQGGLVNHIVGRFGIYNTGDVAHSRYHGLCTSFVGKNGVMLTTEWDYIQKTMLTACLQKMQQLEQKIKAIVFIWFIAALFYLYEFFLRTFVGSIAQQLIHDLHLTIEQFTLIGSAYYLAYGIMQIPVGVLVDKFGVKIIMIFATLMCALATFLFSHETSHTTALLGRLFMGFGSSFAFVCLLVIASNWFPKRFFSFFAGLSQFIGTMVRP